MSLEDLLRSTHRLEDLSRLCRSLGYEDGFRELPPGAFPGGERAAILADAGGFAWYGVAAPGGALALVRAHPCRMVLAMQARPYWMPWTLSTGCAWQANG